MSGEIGVGGCVLIAAIEGVLGLSERACGSSCETFAVTIEPRVELDEMGVVGGRVDVPEERFGCILGTKERVLAANDQNVELREEGVELGLCDGLGAEPRWIDVIEVGCGGDFGFERGRDCAYGGVRVGEGEEFAPAVWPACFTLSPRARAGQSVLPDQATASVGEAWTEEILR